MFILIPPSEGKNTGGSGSVRLKAPASAEDVLAVLAKLRKLSVPAAGKLYGIADPGKARAAHEKNLSTPDAPAMKAFERYSGVVYDHIGCATLSDPKAAGERVLIASALYGLIRGSDRIADYKLPMNPTWARQWRTINSNRLRAIAKRGPVVSLLPQAHAKAIELEDIPQVEFRVTGGKKSAGHFGKAIKGKFVRFLLEERITQFDDFARFREDGYRWDGQNFIQK